MAIVLAKGYVDALDEIYKLESVTNDLTGDRSLFKEGARPNEILYPHIKVNGLGNYSRSSGYTNNNVQVGWESATFNYDRGTKITVDTMDNMETFDIAFGMASRTLMREQVAPEADAFVFAKIAGTTGISKAAPVTYSSVTDFMNALLEAKTVMDEDEVPETDRILYATPTLLNGLLNLETYKSKEIINSFSTVKRVPQSRFYTAIDLLDGKSSGEEMGGFKKATGGKDINFMIIHKPALIKTDKHVVSSIITPDNNPDSDAYILKYRKYGIVDVYKNKAAGIYLSHKA